jgi:tetratricopeptide (TPR) repeat protein
MKKFLVAGVLAMTVTAFSQSDTAQPQQQPSADAQSGQQPKSIKDPAEYNAYMSAMGMTDPAQKASAFEQFAQQYPQSVGRVEALQASMAAYPQAGNPAKALQLATQVLQANPNHVEALAVSVYFKRQALGAGQNVQQNASELSQLAPKGLQLTTSQPKPAGITDEEFKKRMQVFTIIFNGAAGQAALVNKDYPTAQKYLRAAVDTSPNDVADVYPLALAYLTPKNTPDDITLNGFWYIARACSLVQQNPQAAQQICNYGRSSVTRFTNKAESWDQLLALAQAQPTPPPDLAQRLPKHVPPTPAEMAQEMIQKTPIKEMSFGEWIFILTSGHQPSADAVWSEIQNKGLRFQGRVIESDKSSITMAVTADGIDANVPEVVVQMLAPMRRPPAAGVDVQIQGVPISYVTSPVFQMSMEQGIPIGPTVRLIGGAAPKAKAKAKTKRRG